MSPVGKGAAIGGVIGLLNFAFASFWVMVNKGSVLAGWYVVFAALGLILGPLLGALCGALVEDIWEPPTESPVPTTTDISTPSVRPPLPQLHSGIRIDKIPVSGNLIVGCVILTVVLLFYLGITIAMPKFGLLILGVVAYRVGQNWISSRKNKSGKSGRILFRDHD